MNPLCITHAIALKETRMENEIYTMTTARLTLMKTLESLEAQQQELEILRNEEWNNVFVRLSEQKRN